MMPRHDCPHLPDVLAATADDCRELSAAMAAHLAACPSCREQADAASFTRQLADTSDRPHQLPDPAVIWWKAQLLRRWQAERAASAPIERMRGAELAAGVASLAAFLFWQGGTLASAVAGFVSKSLASASSGPAQIQPMVPLLVAGLGVSLIVMFLATLHRRLGGHHV